MKKIIYIPLDERPCNYNFPSALLENNNDLDLIRPGLEIMGNKKEAANYSLLEKFILDNAKDSFGLVISIDMLLYGGLVPSRLHHLTAKDVESRLNLLDKVKELNPSIKIFAFSLIMRTPQYSSDDEEPSYYQEVGLEIFKRGELSHKKMLNIATNEELVKFDEYISKTDKYIDDYLNRRKVNALMVTKALNKVNNIIDFFVIPQDDSSPYGYTKLDQEMILAHIESINLKDINIYPGADEVGMILVTRMINYINNKTPNIYVEYSSKYGGNIIPLYEDRQTHLTVEAQILTSGSKRVDNIDDAELVLMINSPIQTMDNPNMIASSAISDDSRDLDLFINNIKKYLVNKKVSVADVSIVNGGEIPFVKKLDESDLIYKLSGYSGWNTSSNTLGTSIFELIYSNYYGVDEALKKFIALRIFEDVAYCGVVRKDVCDFDLPKMNLGYFNSGESEGIVSQIVKEKIIIVTDVISPVTNKMYNISKCYMPWTRMFEVGLIIEKHGGK